jgi:hypothetical protein
LGGLDVSLNFRVLFQELAELCFGPFNRWFCLRKFVATEVVRSVRCLAAVTATQDLASRTDNVLLLDPDFTERGLGVVNGATEEIADNCTRVTVYYDVQVAWPLRGCMSGCDGESFVPQLVNALMRGLGFIVVINVNIDKPLSGFVATTTAFHAVVPVDFRIIREPCVPGIEGPFLPVVNIDEPFGSSACVGQ